MVTLYVCLRKFQTVTRIELLRKQSNVDGINKTITVRSGYGRYLCKFLDPSVIYIYVSSDPCLVDDQNCMNQVVINKGFRLCLINQLYICIYVYIWVGF